MGARSIKLPDVGEGIAEAEIVEWLVKVGDYVKEDQVVSAVMTDKATVEIPTPVGGTVLALGAEVGSTLAIGAELIRLDVADGASSNTGQAPVAAPEPQTTPAIAVAAEPKPAAPAKSEPKVAASSSFAKISIGEKPLASPSVRLQAKDFGIDLQSVHGTGPAGRILHEDVEAYS